MTGGPRTEPQGAPLFKEHELWTGHRAHLINMHKFLGLTHNTHTHTQQKQNNTKPTTKLKQNKGKN